MKAFFYLTSIVLAAALTILFTALNPGEVTVDLYFRQIVMPFSLVVILSIFVGALLGFSLGAIVVFSRNRALRKLSKRLNEAESELSNLRKLPIQEL
ncbi:MAG TPA: LapA family protein [Gammaproteobacteria bacterium]|nr:LapA family protein [Gammaproteobacteria bacterium]